MAKSTKSDNKQTEILIGVALILLGAIFAYFALSQPAAVESNVSNLNNQTTVSNANNSEDEDGEYYINRDEIYNVSYPLNLNSCTAEELMTIDGIGETKANSIIAYRDVIGEYTSVEQLKNISGIGDLFFEKIAPYATV